MEKLFLAGIAAVGLFGASAVAANLPSKAPPYKTPVAAVPYNWSELYVGANFGGAWTNGSLTIPRNNFCGGITDLMVGGGGWVRSDATLNYTGFVIVDYV